MNSNDSTRNVNEHKKLAPNTKRIAIAPKALLAPLEKINETNTKQKISTEHKVNLMIAPANHTTNKNGITTTVQKSDQQSIFCQKEFAVVKSAHGTWILIGGSNQYTE